MEEGFEMESNLFDDTTTRAISLVRLDGGERRPEPVLESLEDTELTLDPLVVFLDDDDFGD